MNFNEDITAPPLFIKPQANVLVPTAVDFGGLFSIIEGRWTRRKKHCLSLNGLRPDPSLNEPA